MQDESYEQFAARLLANFSKNDHLGKAAIANDKAKAAEAAADYDSAWRFYHEQKEQYLQHASKNKFTAAQTLALDASVSQQLANILRVEGKHDDALVHILYWICSSATPTKIQRQKLAAYFNRCRFKRVSTEDLRNALEALRKNPEFMEMRNAVGRWRGFV